MSVKKEYVIEFTLFEKNIRATVYAESDDQARDNLFKAIAEKVIIKSMDVPNNMFNHAMDIGQKALNVLGRKAKAKDQ